MTARSPSDAKGIPPCWHLDTCCPGKGAPPPLQQIHGWKALNACTTPTSVFIFVTAGHIRTKRQIPAPLLVCVELNPGPPRQPRQQRAQPAAKAVTALTLQQLQQQLAEQQLQLTRLALKAGPALTNASPRTGRPKPTAPRPSSATVGAPSRHPKAAPSIDEHAHNGKLSRGRYDCSSRPSPTPRQPRIHEPPTSLSRSEPDPPPPQRLPLRPPTTGL